MELSSRVDSITGRECGIGFATAQLACPFCGLSVYANALSEAEFCVNSGSMPYFEESLTSQVERLNE